MRPLKSGRPMRMMRSKRPGRTSAGSRTSFLSAKHKNGSVPAS